MDGFEIELVRDRRELLRWRMEVITSVFGIQDEESFTDLMRANEEYYRRHAEHWSHVACKAVINGRDAGCGAMCMQEELPSPDNPGGICAYLMNIYVRERYRGHGAGTSIVKWLVDEARRRGAGKIYLESTEKALPLYRKLGFEDMVNYLKIDKYEDHKSR